jgi:hypothetical protein
LARFPERTDFLLNNRDFRSNEEFSYLLLDFSESHSALPLTFRALPKSNVSGGAHDAPWPPCDVEEVCGQSTPQCAFHIQGLCSPPDKKIASAAVITTRPNRALSRLKSTTEANSPGTRVRVTLVLVVINSSLRSRHDSESRPLPCA